MVQTISLSWENIWFYRYWWTLMSTRLSWKRSPVPPWKVCMSWQGTLFGWGRFEWIAAYTFRRCFLHQSRTEKIWCISTQSRSSSLHQAASLASNKHSPLCTYNAPHLPLNYRPHSSYSPYFSRLLSLGLFSIGVFTCLFYIFAKGY